MIVQKGQHIHVKHNRKGEFDAIALQDFDSDITEFYPLVLAKGSYVKGVSICSYWEAGDEIPCRKSQCTISIV